MDLGEIFLWGRSLGAVTIILFLEINEFKINSVILDSPFLKIKDTLIYYLKNTYGYSQFLFRFLLNISENQILKKTGHNILNIDLEKCL